MNCFIVSVEYARNPFAYFAKQLHRAIEVANVDDQTLIRIIITRSEIDLGSIKKEYKKLYNKTLRSEIKVRFFEVIYKVGT